MDWIYFLSSHQEHRGNQGSTKHKPLTSTSGLASSFLHPPPDSWQKGRCSLTVGSSTPAPWWCTNIKQGINRERQEIVVKQWMCTRTSWTVMLWHTMNYNDPLAFPRSYVQNTVSYFVQRRCKHSSKYAEPPFWVSAFSIMTWGWYCSSYFISRQKSWSATNLFSCTCTFSHICILQEAQLLPRDCTTCYVSCQLIHKWMKNGILKGMHYVHEGHSPLFTSYQGWHFIWVKLVLPSPLG